MGIQIIKWLNAAMEAPTLGLRSRYLELIETAMPRCEYTGSYLLSLWMKYKSRGSVYKVLSEYGF